MRYDPMLHPPPLPAVSAIATLPVARTVLLVNPFYAKDRVGSYGKHVLTPSLALPSLAAVTPAEWTVRFWDENLLQGAAPVDPVPEVVGITVHLTFAERAYAIGRFFRALGSKVVMGGPHVLACPDEVAPHCDAIAIGNGVSLWPRILRDVAAKQLAPRYEAAYSSSFADEPPPRHDLPPAWGFLTRASLVATRGCHNRCDFCFLSIGEHRMRYEMRPVEDVAREFATAPSPYGVFVDNNLGASRPYLHKLCAAIEPVGKIWSAAITLDTTDDPSLVRAMALAGCTGVFVGFESLNDDNLVHAGKRSPRARDYARRVALLHDHGIQVNGSFVFGFDGDGPEVFAQTADWIESTRLECATFHILTPYPGTPLFRRLEAEGRILHRDWSRYDTAHAVFQPKRMTPEALESGYAALYKRVFSLHSIWARRPIERAAVLPYLAMSLLYKRSNALWRRLIRHRLTPAMWSPLVHLSRWRHLAYRNRLRLAPVALRLPVPPGV